MNEYSIPFIEERLAQSNIQFGNHWRSLKANIRKQFPDQTLVFIIDQSVLKWHFEKIKILLTLKNAHQYALSLSESQKNLKTVNHIVSFLQKKQCGRDTVLIAIGGGVLGDVVGFVASIYHRGLPYIQIPTTLISMVDSSIGGKTGVNDQGVKNQLGTFYLPTFTWIDFGFLKTLPEREMQSGWFEMLKMMLISNHRFLRDFKKKNHFDFNEINMCELFLKKNPMSQSKIKCFFDWIKVSIFLKQTVIEKDFKENGVRSILNFGHTLGHALECVSRYRLSHGVAVGYGMLFASYVSHQMGYLRHFQYQTIKNWIQLDKGKLKKMKWEKIKMALLKDKKNINQDIRFVLLKSIGKIQMHEKSYTHPISVEHLTQFWMLFLEENHVRE